MRIKEVMFRSRIPICSSEKEKPLIGPHVLILCSVLVSESQDSKTDSHGGLAGA